MSEDRSAIITKVEGSGGLITPASCKEQLLYEIQDPSAHRELLNVVADFTQVEIEEARRDRIRIYGGLGRREKVAEVLGVADRRVLYQLADKVLARDVAQTLGTWPMQSTVAWISCRWRGPSSLFCTILRS